MTAVTPVLQIRRSDSGKEICVAATWPDGRFQEISGFHSETEANEWIANKFQQWLDEHQDGAKSPAEGSVK
jgi:hypothetical protein